MMQALQRLLYVVECNVFELCGPFEENGQTDYYVPYMMNDAVEDYLILKNCRIVGEYLAETELPQEAQLAENESGYVLAVRQGDENAFTLYFEEIEEKVQCYQYHEIGHFWVEGQEQWRQLVYMIGTIYDKYTFLGESFCNEQELELLRLVEFAPFRAWSPIHESLDDTYEDSEEGLEAMERFAEMAGDRVYLKWIAMYQRFPWLSNVLANQLLNPKREELYRVIFDKVCDASAQYQKRDYGEQIDVELARIREKVNLELKSQGFMGSYPEYEKGTTKIIVTEEHPFTIMEWDHYKFKIQFMVSECKKPIKNKRNSGFFKGRGRKGWIEKYDKL